MTKSEAANRILKRLSRRNWAALYRKQKEATKTTRNRYDGLSEKEKNDKREYARTR